MIAGHTIEVNEHNLAIIETTNATKNLIAALPTLESTESDDDDDLPKIIAIYSNDKPNIIYLSESESDENTSALISNKEKQNLYCYYVLHNYYRTDLLAAWFKSAECQDRLQKLREFVTIYTAWKEIIKRGVELKIFGCVMQSMLKNKNF